MSSLKSGDAKDSGESKCSALSLILKGHMGATLRRPLIRHALLFREFAESDRFDTY